MNNNSGNLLVSFCAGDMIGQYGAGERVLHNIAQNLGGFIDRVFDMYLEFSAMADEGLLLRREYGHNKGGITLAFYYLPGVSITQKRQQIINILLQKYFNDPVYPRTGVYAVQENNGNYQLLIVSKFNVFDGNSPVTHSSSTIYIN